VFAEVGTMVRQKIECYENEEEDAFINLILDGEAVGSARYFAEGWVHLTKMVIPKEMRHQGLGTKFLRLLAHYIRRKETFPVITLTAVNPENQERVGAYYERFGFKKLDKDFWKLMRMNDVDEQSFFLCLDEEETFQREETYYLGPAGLKKLDVGAFDVKTVVEEDEI
jgi:N-acetylglutamate synthase-like GNAT family acetyltransferase